jgi:hypothetical protein
VAIENEARRGRRVISLQETTLYLALRDSGEWMSIADLAERAKMTVHTVRVHARRFAELGIAECVELFPGNRYRLGKARPQGDGADYVKRLEVAVAAFGLAKDARGPDVETRAS